MLRAGISVDCGAERTFRKPMSHHERARGRRAGASDVSAEFDACAGNCATPA